MLKFWRKNRDQASTSPMLGKAVHSVLESLESRRLMHGGFGGAGFGGFHGGGGFGDGPGGAPGGDQSITFSLVPTAVQTGLDALAKTDGLSDPASTAKVQLGNSNGVETYSVTIDGTGTVSRLTVDQLGNPVTAPTFTTTTWAALSGTGTGSDVAAASEISKIATAESLTAPVATTVVDVTTTSASAVTYSVHLTSSSTSTSTAMDWFNPTSTVPVDAAGNPVGSQVLAFSVFSSTIQNALIKNAPTGATALTASSTSPVTVRTTDGATTYSVTYTVIGTQSIVTVNSAGTLTSLPTTTTTTFGALPSKLQTELQTLATADGVTTTIASNQSINVLTETTGTVLYSATLGATGTGTSGSTFSFDVTIAVDSDGNPTVLPHDGGSDGGFGGPRGFFDGQNDCGNGGGTTANSSSGSSSSNSSSAAVTLPSGGSASATSITALSTSTYALSAKFLSAGEFGLAALGGYLVEFAPGKANTTVIADAVTLLSDVKQLGSDTKALTSAQKKTLETDEKAVSTAISGLKATLSPLEATLKSDASSAAKTLKADKTAIARDKKSATALAAAQAKLITDESTEFDLIARDVSAITSVITGSAAVATAQSRLATDLPTIASDQTAIKSAATQLISVVETQLASA